MALDTITGTLNPYTIPREILDRIGVIEGDITTIEGDITTIEGDITDIENAIPISEFDSTNTVKDYIDDLVDNAYNFIDLDPYVNIVGDSDFYAQSMVIIGTKIYTVWAGIDGINKTRIYVYDTSSETTTYEEYANTVIGHGNYLAYDGVSLITSGQDNNSFVCVDPDTLQVSKTISLNVPFSGLSFSPNKSSAIGMPSNRKIMLTYNKNPIESGNVYSVVTTNKMQFQAGMVLQDTTFANSENFAISIFLDDRGEKKINHIIEYEIHNGMMLRDYVANVENEIELEGIYNIGDTTYIIDATGQVYTCELSLDYRTTVAPFNITTRNPTSYNLTATSNDSHTFQFTPIILYPYAYRDWHFADDVIVAGYSNSMRSVLMHNSATNLQGVINSYDNDIRIVAQYTLNSGNFYYLSKLQINNDTGTFSYTNYTQLVNAIKAFIAATDISRNCGFSVRGIGNSPFTSLVYNVDFTI